MKTNIQTSKQNMKHRNQNKTHMIIMVNAHELDLGHTH